MAPALRVRIAVPAALAALAVPVATAAAQDGDAPPQEVLRAAESAVLVHTELHRGTGFVVEPEAGEVATAAAVLRDREEARITTLDGRAMEVEVAGRDQVAGLAVLRAEAVRAQPLELATESADEGDRVFAIGPPVGYGGDRIRELEVTDLSAEGAERRIELDGGVADEGEGGPLVTPDGTVVGVIVADGDDGATAVPVGRVKRVPRVAADGLPWPLIWLGALGALVTVGLLSAYATARSRRNWERRRRATDDSARARAAIEEGQEEELTSR